MRKFLYLTVFAAAAILQSCVSNVENGLSAGKFSDWWTVESESPDYSTKVSEDGVCEIVAPKGLTLWFNRKFSGDVEIKYEAIVYDEKEGDRLSDLNCFWMATDPKAETVFDRMDERNGVFANCASMKLYYVGYGGNWTSLPHHTVAHRDQKLHIPQLIIQNYNRMKFKYLLLSLAMFAGTFCLAGEKYNFNSDWLLKVGDIPSAEKTSFNDRDWEKVTLPHAFNEDEAFKNDIRDLTDTVMWYRKHFVLPREARGQKVFVEFEGARQGVDLYVNGRLVGKHENGVMAFGFDLTPYVKTGKNVMAVRVDNDWNYAERSTGVKYQWSNNNFNANYGGLPKNVWLHIPEYGRRG